MTTHQTGCVLARSGPSALAGTATPQITQSANVINDFIASQRQETGRARMGNIIDRSLVFDHVERKQNRTLVILSEHFEMDPSA